MRRIVSGDEYIDRGYTRVFHNGKWYLKQRLVWEQIYGPIPKGYIICFLDGNRGNCAIDNLACVPRPVATSVSKTLGRERTPELTRTQILLFTLEQKVREVSS